MHCQLRCVQLGITVMSLFTTALSVGNVENTGPPLPNRPFVSVWDAPSEICADKWNVTLNLSSFDIVSNRNMSWLGEFMVIFYHKQLGLYPYFDDNGVAINGGLPQLADFEGHFAKATKDINNFIPDSDFQGIAVIDWEFWKPVFDRNVASKVIYSLRPKALWGYYGFPRCYGDDGKPDWLCSNSTRQLNDQIGWLFKSSSALFPSIYLKTNRAIKAEEFVRYQLKEAFRLAQNTKGNSIPVFPYVRFVYGKSEVFLNEGDLLATVGQSAEMATGGTVIWGSYTDFSSKLLCLEVQSYVDQLLGPFVRYLTKIAQNCGAQNCNEHGRCEFQLTSIPDMDPAVTLRTNVRDSWKFIRCKCYVGWSGEKCQERPS